MSTVLNAAGVPLAYSQSSKYTYNVTAAGQVLTGSATHDSLWAKSGMPATLVGGGGDDKYFVYNRSDVVLEEPGGGVDIVTVWMNYTLPENVENLRISGDKLYGFGNALDNIVLGGAGRQTIDGMAGNDVLRGGADADMFVIRAGNGSDAILDFSPLEGDVVRLHGYALTTFDAARAAMTQVGADVRLDLGDGEILVFRDRAIADITAESLGLPVDLSGHTLVFADEFDALSLFSSGAGTWKTTHYWGDRALGTNGEKQQYVDPAYKGLGLDPFAIENGVLTITAAPASDELRPLIDDQPYTSGMLSSEQSFSMQYGYFEMRAEIPAGKGLWPAFWLLTIDGDWPPEIDVMEVLGHDTNLLYASVHSKATGAHTMSSLPIGVTDMAEGFHTYAVDWGPETITWYFDGIEVYSVATPADMHQPMYMIANLAVGGYWPGDPDATTPFPAEMKIDWIRAYQRPADAPAIAMPESWDAFDLAGFSTLDGTGARTSSAWRTNMAEGEVALALSGDGARYAGGNSGDNWIRGSSAPFNELDGRGGNDVLQGGRGIDVFVVRAGEGSDVILDFSDVAGNTDKIRLDGFHFSHFDHVKPFLTQVGADTLLRLSADQAVLLRNVAADALGHEQFVFVNPVAAPVEAAPNTPAAITGVAAAALVEDAAPVLAASGVLAVADPDAGEAGLRAQSVAGAAGVFRIAADGSWTYEADDAAAAVQALRAGETLVETAEAVSIDGSARATLSVAITGVNDAATIAGVATAVIGEDDAPAPTATEALAVADVDAGEAGLRAGAVAGALGAFLVSTDGTWSYAADAAAVQALRAGETRVETAEAVSLDGSARTTLSVTIVGANDAATITGDDAATLVEDAAATLVAEGRLVVADADAGEAGVLARTAQGAYGVFTIAADGAWTYVADNAAPALQALAAGEVATERFAVSSLDGSATHLVTIAIGGVDEPEPRQPLVLLESAAPTKTILGTIRADVLTGTDGNDRLDGRDVIRGPKASGDVLEGGRGDDTYMLRDADDRVIEAAGEGVDTVASRVAAYTLADGVENLRLFAPTAQTGIGNDASNILWANAVGSVLDGGEGDDILHAGKGVDRLTGGAGSDMFSFAPEKVGVAPDRITDFQAGADLLDLRRFFAGNTEDPLGEGFVLFEATSAGARVLVDRDGAGGESAIDLVLLEGVSADDFAAGQDWIWA